MENTTKKTAEEKAIEREQRKLERHLKFLDNHFVYEYIDGENVIEIPLNGTWCEKGIAFTYDANSYIGVVDDGANNPFIKAYTRCKETSKQYYIKSKLVKNNQKFDYEIISGCCTDKDGNVMTFSSMLEKAKRIYKETRTKRVIEVIDFCINKAQKVAEKKAKAEERAKAKESKVDNIAV